MKKYCWSRKGKQGDEQHENNQEENVARDVLQYALIFSLYYITKS